MQSVSDDELVAVVRHERYHVHNRDPLKVLALRTLAAAFFFIPLAGIVLQRLLDRQELKADRAAVGDSGVAPVAGALLKAVGQPAAAPGTAMAAMGGPGLLDARVSQLETGHGPRFFAGIPAASLFASMPGVGLLAGYGALLYWVCLTVEHCCMR